MLLLASRRVQPSNALLATVAAVGMMIDLRAEQPSKAPQWLSPSMEVMELTQSY